jgi:hypothetical protein
MFRKKIDRQKNKRKKQIQRIEKATLVYLSVGNTGRSITLCNLDMNSSCESGRTRSAGCSATSSTDPGLPSSNARAPFAWSASRQCRERGAFRSLFRVRWRAPDSFMSVVWPYSELSESPVRHRRHIDIFYDLFALYRFVRTASLR